jgi:hypothetical protein
MEFSMNNTVMSGQEFKDSLAAMPLEARIYTMKAIKLYFDETKLDELDFRKMREWVAVTPAEQIEAQPLSRQMRRNLQRLDKGNKQVTH